MKYHSTLHEMNRTISSDNLNALIESHMRMTVGEAAEAFGVDAKWLSKICKEGVARINEQNFDAMRKIARYFDLDVYELFARDLVSRLSYHNMVKAILLSPAGDNFKRIIEDYYDLTTLRERYKDSPD